MDCNSGDAQAPITDKSQLVAYMAEGCKPAELWRIGTEHEKFTFYPDSLEPLAYEGPKGVRAVLEALLTMWPHDWEQFATNLPRPQAPEPQIAALDSDENVFGA
ncbi:MAG: hypothetical protein QGF09_17545, partial [Rhodospirillales bacterium]|nr:hypothetical protein [Rhodospirillales bacterium]